ncbi:ZIP family metal transporter [Niallia sp. 01092]|uniref:ZIP family metal transporter n=1 Tax=unclassified Niallia TaxID=2837522 RepID=UPI003FD12585
MLEAAIWGALASMSLLIGSIIGIFFTIPKKIIAYLMALGTGVLIGASSFDLLIESLHISGLCFTISSFLSGSFLFTIIELFLYKKGGANRKRSNKKTDNHSGIAIFAGTLMDAIPESLIIGLSILTNNKVDALFILAIFISNFPEALSSTVGLKMGGFTNNKIVSLWASVVFISSISSLIGFIFLKNFSEVAIANIEAFGAGGLVAMVCSTMLPEAFEKGGPIIGFITCFGLMISLTLTYISF